MNFEKFTVKSESDQPVLHVVWQPGNGTRYEVVVTPLEASEPEAVMISWHNHHGGRCMSLRVDDKVGELMFTYVCEKLGVNVADGAALTALLSRVTPRVCVLPAGYDKYGCFERKAGEDEHWGHVLVNGEVNEPNEATG